MREEWSFKFVHLSIVDRALIRQLMVAEIEFVSGASKLHGTILRYSF